MDMVATVLSAAAASIAAVLAGFNLYVSGRRERVRWNREALMETFGAFLHASFAGKDAVKAAIEISFSATGQERIPQLHRDAQAIEYEMRRLQTRLLLLTSTEVVDAAQALRAAVRDYVSLLNAVDELSPELDQEARRELWRLRERFVAAAKQTLSL